MDPLLSEEYFQRPERVIAALREDDPVHHITLRRFGRGPHYCIGANLAQLEMGIMLDAALDVLPEDSKLFEERIDWMRLGMFSRAESLPIDFGS